MSNKFKAKFLKILQEAPELDIDPELERDAADMSLDDDVAIDDFDVDTTPDPDAMNEVGYAVSRLHQQMASTVDQWSAEIDNFIEYLNGSSSNSVQTIIGNATEGTILGKLKNKQDNIGRIAADLAALQQAFMAAKQYSQ